PGDPYGLGVVAGTGHTYLEEYARNLTVGGDHPHQVECDLVKCFLERGRVHRTGQTISEDRRRVTGGGVGVDAQRLEGAFHNAAEDLVQHRLLQVGVGEEPREHGRHVRLDHADALGDAG